MNDDRPKSDGHHSIGRPCPACDTPFERGDFTTLIARGPGGDEEGQGGPREGRPYNTVALEVHWPCATGGV